MKTESENRDKEVIKGFGEEWTRFPQDTLSEAERDAIFENYFSIFPWDELPPHAIGADIGCGSGRWAAVVAPKVGKLLCVDASSDALTVARHNLSGLGNVIFQQADVGEFSLAEEKLDFVYSLGVLHHVPDTAGAIGNVAKLLKSGGHFLVYLYYAFDNRPCWFHLLWRISDRLRRILCRLPSRLRFFICDLIAALVYFPLARIALILEFLGFAWQNFPLWFYRDKSFYVMRTDALDRFGTRLEQRFTREQIATMLEDAGFIRIRFSPNAPFWCVVGCKR